MQPILPGMPPAEAYAIIAAMTVAAANQGDNNGGAGMLPRSAGVGTAPQPPRLGASGSSAFATYKPPPQPRLCQPPVHGPPQPSISLATGLAAPQPLRPGMPPLPVLPQGGSMPAGMPSTMQGLVEMMQAAAAAQQLQAQQQASFAGAAALAMAPSTAPAVAPGSAPSSAPAQPTTPSVASPAPAAAAGRASSASAASEKLKASRMRYQEKNRRAQARFRERQKVRFGCLTTSFSL